MEYRSELDGLRAFAVLAVLLFHAGVPSLKGGFVGVDVFFVLSGFLITSLLAAEYREAGKIDLLSFYWRRALRLYPSLLLMLTVFIVASLVVSPGVDALSQSVLAALYLTDYARALFGTPIELSHTWSLSVEEHFYVVWPLALPWILRCRLPLRVLLGLWVAATAWRVFNHVEWGWTKTYFRFDTRLSGLVLGCAIALWPQLRVATLWVCIAVAGLLLTISLGAYQTFGGITVGVTVAEICAALLILGSRYSFVNRWLGALPLVYVGRLSYGIYLWHYPIVVYLRGVNADWTTKLAISGMLSVGLAALCHHLVEIKLRRYRDMRRIALPVRVSISRSGGGPSSSRLSERWRTRQQIAAEGE
jgi:peptidoglycan/LPS O-acetylase OafA/YrhL